MSNLKEALMNTASRFIATLVPLVALAAAPSAFAAIDYSKNAAGGTYAPATSPAVPGDGGFAWGDALLGAAVALAVILLVVAMRRVHISARSRRELAPGAAPRAS
jgi:hypothetical protein